MHDEVGDMVGGCLVLRPRLAPNGLPGEQNVEVYVDELGISMGELDGLRSSGAV